mmetsp:Transcript_86322/g.234038  ORF Transcript_86322/g.234038 Transcript_86322/m.234038 type:complete len:301 (+) Transcript_86322:583-1485(+)
MQPRSEQDGVVRVRVAAELHEARGLRGRVLVRLRQRQHHLAAGAHAVGPSLVSLQGLRQGAARPSQAEGIRQQLQVHGQRAGGPGLRPRLPAHQPRVHRHPLQPQRPQRQRELRPQRRRQRCWRREVAAERHPRAAFVHGLHALQNGLVFAGVDARHQVAEVRERLQVGLSWQLHGLRRAAPCIPQRLPVPPFQRGGVRADVQNGDAVGGVPCPQAPQPRSDPAGVAGCAGDPDVLAARHSHLAGERLEQLRLLPHHLQPLVAAALPHVQGQLPYALRHLLGAHRRHPAQGQQPVLRQPR